MLNRLNLFFAVLFGLWVTPLAVEGTMRLGQGQSGNAWQHAVAGMVAALASAWFACRAYSPKHP